MNTKKIVIPLLLLAQSTLLFAKGDNTIKGKVTNSANGQPIEYATAVLLSLPDSTVKKSALTDQNGDYIFTAIAAGRYTVRAQFVGYKPNNSEAFDCKGETNLQAIGLESSASIAQVTVTGKKPFIEKKADRTVLNIDESATASAENAYEVLRKAPNVSIDKDDNINLNGKQGVTITVNDRPTQLSGTDLANYLKSVQGNEIEKIEIINTPPARYEASGNTGVINIKIKKNLKPGFNGSVYVGEKYNEKWAGFGGGSVNFRKGKVNVYANVHKGSYKGDASINIDRQLTVEDDGVNMTQFNSDDWDFKTNSFRTGIDFDINKNNTIGVLINGYSNKNNEHIIGDMIFLNPLSANDTVSSNNTSNAKYKNMSYNVNYRTVFDTLGTSLNIDVDYAKFDNDTKNINYNIFNDHTLKLRSTFPSNIEIKSAKADFYHPIGKSMKLEAGLKYSNVETDNNMQYFNVLPDKETLDKSRSNHFVYDESITAGYVSLQYEIGNTSLKGGLRAENTDSKGDSKTMDKVVKRSYIDFFPSFFVQQKLNDNNSIGLTYNRRIDRPNYGSLNPFAMYIDEYTISEGNPFLKPQYTNNISLNYSWKNMYFTEVTYSHTSDIMLSVLKQKEGTAKVSETPDNLNGLNSYTWTNSLNISPTKWFRSNINASLMYNEYMQSSDVKNSRTSFYAYSSNTFILPQKFTFELMGWYQSPMVYGIFRMNEKYSIGMGLQKTMLEDKLRIKLSADDVFNTLKNKSCADDNGVSIVSRNRWSSRSFTLNITYRFGSDTVKPSRDRKTGLESESNRISTGSK